MGGEGWKNISLVPSEFNFTMLAIKKAKYRLMSTVSCCVRLEALLCCAFNGINWVWQKVDPLQNTATVVFVNFLCLHLIPLFKKASNFLKRFKCFYPSWWYIRTFLTIVLLWFLTVFVWSEVFQRYQMYCEIDIKLLRNVI